MVSRCSRQGKPRRGRSARCAQQPVPCPIRNQACGIRLSSSASADWASRFRSPLRHLRTRSTACIYSCSTQSVPWVAETVQRASSMRRRVPGGCSCPPVSLGTFLPAGLCGTPSLGDPDPASLRESQARDRACAWRQPWRGTSHAARRRSARTVAGAAQRRRAGRRVRPEKRHQHRQLFSGESYLPRRRLEWLCGTLCFLAPFVTRPDYRPHADVGG